MKWCRVIESEGDCYLMVAAETAGGWGIVTSWMTPFGMLSGVVPPCEFKGRDDCLEFLAAMRPENALAMRQEVERCLAQVDAAESAQEVAEAVIARAKASLH